MVCGPFKWLFNQEAVAFLLPQKKVRKKEKWLQLKLMHWMLQLEKNEVEFSR